MNQEELIEEILRDVQKIENLYLKGISTKQMAMQSGEILKAIRDIKEKAQKSKD